MTGKTATETAETMRHEGLRINRRYMRAQQLTAAIMNLLKDHIETHGDEDHHREAHYKLLALFSENGFEVVTDGDRERAGVEPRDEKGWTATEMVEMERRIMDAMLTPTVYFVRPLDRENKSL